MDISKKEPIYRHVWSSRLEKHSLGIAVMGVGRRRSGGFVRLPGIRKERFIDFLIWQNASTYSIAWDSLEGKMVIPVKMLQRGNELWEEKMDKAHFGFASFAFFSFSFSDFFLNFFLRLFFIFHIGFGDYIYSLGGLKGTNRRVLSAIRRWDISKTYSKNKKERKWEFCQKIKLPKESFDNKCLIVANRFLHVLGGTDRFLKDLDTHFILRMDGPFLIFCKWLRDLGYEMDGEPLARIVMQFCGSALW